MFQVDVVSDPGAALFPSTRMWDADLAALTAYDVTLVKPSLLFADRVRLKTFRADMCALVESSAQQVLAMPMRRLHHYIGLSIRRHPGELARIGITESLLAPATEARALIDDDVTVSQLNRFEERYWAEIAEVMTATLGVLRTNRELLASPELDTAVSKGILTTEGWAISHVDPWSMAWTPTEDFLKQGVLELLRHVASGTGALMFEPGARLVLGKSLGHKTSQLRVDVSQPATPATVAASMAAHLPGLREATVHEILEVRDDLRDYLPQFRSAMVDLADEVAEIAGENETALARELEVRWYRDIRPQLAEMTDRARRESYPRQVLNALVDSTGGQVGGATSVVLAAGSLVAGLPALVPAAAAASVPFLKALKSTLETRDDLRGSRLYFLYGASKHLTR